jgi:hypothetical protein
MLALAVAFVGSLALSPIAAAMDVDGASGPRVVTRVDPASRTVTVAPSGGDDTAAVQAALDTCVALGPGCTVRLEEGTFRTRQLLTHDFHGTFRGAGQDATVIEPLGTFPVNDDEVVLARPPAPDHPWPMHVQFVDGDVTVSDLTLRMTGAEPAEPWTLFGMEFTVMAASLLITGEVADAVVERVTVEGGEGSFQGYNLINGVYIEGLLPDANGEPTRPLRGTFAVRDSTFRSLAYGSPLFNLTDSLARIEGNRYEDVFSALDSQDLSATTVEIRDNVVDGAGIGFEIIQGSWAVPEEPSTLLLHGNEVRGVEIVGVGLDGAEGADTLRALVVANRFELTGDAVGVISRNTAGARVLDNVFHGEGRAAVALAEAPDDGSPAPPVLGWTVDGNDLSAFTAAQASVVLGPGSDGVTVLCRAPAPVQDDGVRNAVHCGE